MKLINDIGNVIVDVSKRKEAYYRSLGYVDYVAPKKEKPKTAKSKQVKVEEPTEE
jgi:hypothetical protein